MRLLAFDDGGTARLGVVQGELVVDLAHAAPELPRDLVGLICSGAGAMAAAAEAARRAKPEAMRPLPGLRFRLPIETAGKIICLGLNYVDHAAEGGHAKPEYPSLFLRCNTSLVAHGEAIWRPTASSKLDYEAELVAVVGRRARHIKAADALAYIAGYSCFNEARCATISARPRNGPSARISSAPAASAPGSSPPTKCRRAPPACPSSRASTAKSCRTPTPAT